MRDFRKLAPLFRRQFAFKAVEQQIDDFFLSIANLDRFLPKTGLGGC